FPSVSPLFRTEKFEFNLRRYQCFQLVEIFRIVVWVYALGNENLEARQLFGVECCNCSLNLREGDLIVVEWYGAEQLRKLALRLLGVNRHTENGRRIEGCYI